jgi:hypothetical protein
MSSCVVGGDTSGIDEAIAKLEDSTDTHARDSDGGPVDN